MISTELKQTLNTNPIMS